MGQATIPELIINSPYDEPREHWKYDPQTRTFSREPGRRPAGFVRARTKSRSCDDPGIFVELPLVNKATFLSFLWADAPPLRPSPPGCDKSIGRILTTPPKGPRLRRRCADHAGRTQVGRLGK